jgi:hypothetical protein
MRNFNLLIGVVALIVAACSDDASKVEGCPFTVDSVSIVDSKEVGGITYYLVHRIFGWSDKTEILELYDSKPEFDHCSNSNIQIHQRYNYFSKKD